MSKILHIFPDSLFLKRYVEITDKDTDNQHYFILTDINSKINSQDKYGFDKVSSLKFLDFIKLRKLLKKYKYDLLIVHSGYLNYLSLSFILNKKILNKTILILWGGTDSKKLEKNKYNRRYLLHIFLYDYFKRKVYRNVKFISSIIKDDYNEVKKIYNVKAVYLPCKYYSANIYQKSMKIKKSEHKNILVGHCGSAECNHIDIFNKLKKFESKNIMVYSALSYGNEKYIKEVIKNGKQVLKEKFAPVKKLLDPDDYNKFLLKMDIIIIDSKIQQGLGNLYSGFYNKKKIYLNSKGKLYDFFTKEGFIISKISEIENQTYEEFIKISDVDTNQNRRNIKKIMNDDEIFKMWKNIFSLGVKNDK